jgi:hypothetical protein
MIWFLPPPPPPSPVIKLSLFLFLVFLCIAGRTYWRERGRRGGGGAKLYDRPRESLVLYKPFNTLWPRGKTETLNGMFYSKSIWVRKAGRGSHVWTHRHPQPCPGNVFRPVRSKNPPHKERTYAVRSALLYFSGPPQKIFSGHLHNAITGMALSSQSQSFFHFLSPQVNLISAIAFFPTQQFRKMTCENGLIPEDDLPRMGKIPEDDLPRMAKFRKMTFREWPIPEDDLPKMAKSRKMPYRDWPNSC